MKKVNTRHKIVQRSREIFKEKGFNQVSLDDLIEATKDTIQRSSFYYHFKDTNLVFSAVIEQCLRNLYAQYSEEAAESENANVFFDRSFSDDEHVSTPFEKFFIEDDDFHLIFSSIRMLFPEQVRIHSETTNTEKTNVPGVEDVYERKKIFFRTLVKRKFDYLKSDEEIDRFLYAADSLCTILWILKNDQFGKALKEGKKIEDWACSLRKTLRLLWDDLIKTQPEERTERSEPVSSRIKELEEKNTELLNTIAKQQKEIYDLRERSVNADTPRLIEKLQPEKPASTDENPRQV